MFYMFCCDLSTLRCTSAELETKIADYSSRYHRLSDNLWLYCAPKDKVSHLFVSPDEYFVTNILREYTTFESVVFSFAIPKTGYYYELPQDAIDFLSIDESDDDSFVLR